MKRSIACVLLAAAGLALAQPSKPPAPPNWPPLKQKDLFADDVRGKPAPKFEVENYMNAEPDRRGKVVLIDFWATWCGPCRKAIPELSEIQAKFKDDLVVIGISDESPATVQDFMAKTEMKYTLAIDMQATMKKAINVRGIPHVIIVSTDGIVRWQGFPLDDNDPLKPEVVKQIIDADPGVKARHEASGPVKPDPKVEHPKRP
jgi:thiol-disulfide isomerase/thioredoxin